MAGLGYIIYLVRASRKGARLIGLSLRWSSLRDREWAVHSPVWKPAPESWWAPPSPAGWMGKNPRRMPAMPCSKHAKRPTGGYRNWRREYPVLTWHAQNHTNRQHHAKIQVCVTRFTTITIQWHLDMLVQTISPISINVVTNLPKYTLNKIVHTIHRATINPANHPAFCPQKQIEYE